MGYLHFSITGTTADDNIQLSGLKLARVSSDFAQADDLYTIDCPDGSTLTLDEAGAETASLTTAGVAFSTTANEAFVLTEASLIAGFPTASAGALVKGGINVAGSAISLTEGLFCIQYNNDSADTLRPFLYIPTILDDIDTLAQSVLDCQCDCNIDDMKAQRYIKARAYLDLIEYKSRNIAASSEIADINAMITKLTDFLTGTEELCESC